jgi:hypothetical protein
MKDLRDVGGCNRRDRAETETNAMIKMVFAKISRTCVLTDCTGTPVIFARRYRNDLRGHVLADILGSNLRDFAAYPVAIHST